MWVRRLRDELLIGALMIGVVVALASMLAVSVVISQQYLEQSRAQLSKASRVVEEQLEDRQSALLAAARQLANQKNLGSTLWYLAQYAKSGLERETLANTYQQLASDTHRIGRVARLSKVAIYDPTGNLISFAQSDGQREVVGYLERGPVPLAMQATLKVGDELDSTALRESKTLPGFARRFDGRLPQQEVARFTINDDKLAIESLVPIVGVAFDPGSGKQEIKQLGLVAAIQFVDEALVDYLSRLTDAKINIFTTRGLSSGSLPAYRMPDWGGGEASPALSPPAMLFNETSIDGAGYYQLLTPIYAEKRLVGSIAVLQSKEMVSRNLWQMVRILGLIAAGCLLIILPFGWLFATRVSRPLTTLSRIFRGVASDERSAALSRELEQLEQGRQRHQEVHDLTRSFIAMDRAIAQKLQQINELNASLEETVAQRTTELRLANEELSNLASHDTLTGLPNRQLLADHVQLALAGARRNETRLALMFIDLDEFKPINDTLGHDCGDMLLKEAARRIQMCMRESDTVARFGGDEFIVLLPFIEQATDALAAAEKIRTAINQPFELAGHRRQISTSIGIAIFPEHGGDEASLFKNADAAMYQAKNEGRNMVRVFSAT